MEIRLELAEARQRQAVLTAAEHQHQAKIEAANFKEASRLLSEMGDKYKEFEASMKDNTEVSAVLYVSRSLCKLLLLASLFCGLTAAWRPSAVVCAFHAENVCAQELSSGMKSCLLA